MWEWVSDLDGQLNIDQPWKKEGKELAIHINSYRHSLQKIAYHLLPIIPTTAQRILKVAESQKVTALSGLFPRILS